MEGIRFIDVLRSFEQQADGEDYEEFERDYDEKRVIENDVRRTVLLGIDKKKTKIMKRILFSTLNEIPVKYTQGMSEIASIFVIYYLQDLIDPNETNGVEESASSEQFINIPDDERIEFEGFMEDHKDQVDKLKVVMTNVFRRKLEPLVVDDFRMYKQNMKIFVEMMRRRGVKIPELESHRFMGSILTFFLRNLSTINNVHKIFEIILSCPNTCPFLLLVFFYDKISKDKTINDVGDDLFPKIIKLEEEFIEVTRKMEERPGFSMTNILVVGGVVSVLAAMFVYRISKKE